MIIALLIHVSIHEQFFFNLVNDEIYIQVFLFHTKLYKEDA